MRIRCVAVCCSVLQRVLVCCSVIHLSYSSNFSEHQVCCSVLQCVAVCCSVLLCHLLELLPQLSAHQVCCSILQCVAVRCRILQCPLSASGLSLGFMCVYVSGFIYVCRHSEKHCRRSKKHTYAFVCACVNRWQRRIITNSGE